MELVKNAGQVALEMGNSAAIVMRHYFDTVERRAQRAFTRTRDLSALSVLGSAIFPRRTALVSTVEKRFESIFIPRPE
jgi:hypothetical protein